MSNFLGIAVGALEIGAALLFAGPLSGIAIAGVVLADLAPVIIAAGAGMIISGIGTLIAGTGQQGVVGGVSSASRNPISPWQIPYGRAAVKSQFIQIGGL